MGLLGTILLFPLPFSMSVLMTFLIVIHILISNHTRKTMRGHAKGSSRGGGQCLIV
jgi:hypothetical protein